MQWSYLPYLHYILAFAFDCFSSVCVSYGFYALSSVDTSQESCLGTIVN